MIILFLILGFTAQGQKDISGTVLYKASHNKTLITENKDNNKEGIKAANELLNNASDIHATLTFNNKESSYRVDDKLEIDGIKSLNITYLFAGGKNLFYHNRDSIHLLEANSSFGKIYLIKQDPPNWIITKETKDIDGLKCVMAYSTTTSGSKEKIDATAWFSPSIPVSYGPMRYFGLPGLIIELQFSKMTFIAEKINLNIENVVIEKHKSQEILSHKEFMEIAKKNAPGFFEN